MNVTEIRNTGVKSIDIAPFKPEIAEKKQVNTIVDKVEINQASASWQKDILLSALDMLENNKQLDNSHPLDKFENSPIESFDEALIELNVLQNRTTKELFSGAQANININDVLNLFVESAA